MSAIIRKEDQTEPTIFRAKPLSKRGKLVVRWLAAREKLEEAKAEMAKLTKNIRKKGPGRHGIFTVYRVKRTIVRGHVRRGYKAVRGKA